MSRIFVDTNVLVYASDDGKPAARDRAMEIWTALLGSPDVPVLSTQVLQEYYNVLTGKLKLPPSEARTKVLLLSEVETVVMTQALVHAAIDLHGSRKLSISFWDALIITAAQSANCTELWTEDMQEGRTFGSLTIVNPFLRR